MREYVGTDLRWLDQEIDHGTKSYDEADAVDMHP